MTAPRQCRVCGCVDNDCSGCVARTGARCYWVGADLCSACAGTPQAMDGSEPEPGLAAADLLQLRHTTFVRVRHGAALIDIGDHPGTGFASGAEVIMRCVHPPAHILRVNFGRSPLSCDVGEVRQDFASLQAYAAGALRIWQDLRAPWDPAAETGRTAR